MNIFYLHKDRQRAAQAHCDKHINKMTLEAVQILNTGLHLADLSEYAFYAPTHETHPWCEWASQSFQQWAFVYQWALALGYEYERRYDKRHASVKKLLAYIPDIKELSGPLRVVSRAQIDSMPQAMPNRYKRENRPVAAYRAYYRHEKLPQQWAKYRHSECPDWLLDGTPMGRWS
jgi:hypothetical protein